MRSVVWGSFVTLILSTGLLVSQVEAKNDDDGGKGKNKFVSQFGGLKKDDDGGKGKNKFAYQFGEWKNDDDDGKGKNKFAYQFGKWKNEWKKEWKNYKYDNGNGRSVPIPGTLLFMGGGFAGLIAWRALRRKSRD